ncbi:hypothetical protein BaRGS_00015272 [Batillaria attramentaria]|uniref:Uncharacterized protein n=1 Tax=Batillaria attramentaria TaxID=370345 RepID=A0ABD0L2R0_9CAEN
MDVHLSPPLHHPHPAPSPLAEGCSLNMAAEETCPLTLGWSKKQKKVAWQGGNICTYFAGLYNSNSWERAGVCLQPERVFLQLYWRPPSRLLKGMFS